MTTLSRDPRPGGVEFTFDTGPDNLPYRFTADELQQLIDMAWEQGVVPRKADEAMRVMHAQLQRPDELTWLRSLVSRAVLNKEPANVQG